VWCSTQNKRISPLPFSHYHHHHPMNVPTADAQAFLMDYT
jgi:hypothetical protein